MKPVVFTGHTRPIKNIIFNKEDDFLFTASQDRYVTLWSTETNVRVGTYFHAAAVSCMDCSLDSKYLVTGDSFGAIYVWNSYDGSLVSSIKSIDGTPISSITFGVSNRDICVLAPFRDKKEKSRVYTFNIDDLIKTKKLDVDINSIPNKVFYADLGKKMTNVKFLNTNKNYLCAFDNGEVELRKDNGDIINSAVFHDKKPIMDLALSSHEELGLSSAKDGKSVLFDPESLEVLNVFKPENPVRNINSGKISPLFNPDLPEENQLRHCFIGGGQESRDVTFTQASEGGFDVLIYDMITGEEIGAIGGHFSPINALALSNSGKILVSGGEEATVRMYVLPSEYYQLNQQ